jgi:uncharacterized coiled-coil protein SlyX
MTQAEGLALEAERSLGRRPLRRTDLLAQRIQDLEPEGQKQRAKVAEAEQKLVKIQAAWSETQGQCVEFAQKLADLEKVYQQRNCPERPNCVNVPRSGVCVWNAMPKPSNLHKPGWQNNKPTWRIGNSRKRT